MRGRRFRTRTAGYPQVRSCNSGGGAVYLVLWVYGLVVDKDSGANVVPVNTADNWLHLTLGVGMIALGIVLSRPSNRRDVPGR